MTSEPGDGSALGPGPEFDRIRAIARALQLPAERFADDCAVLPRHDGTIVVSTDVSVEGRHFRREWLSLEEIGYRAAAAALSDLAADGASATALLAAVTSPADANPNDVTQLMRGVGEAARAAGALVLGGDLSEGPVWSIGVTVIGHVETPVTRAGARVGDGLWVTGALGGARVALECWLHGSEPPSVARAAFAHPVPRLGAGRALVGLGARAMLDLSDGLASDAWHLAAASRVALVIELDAIPRAPDVVALGQQLGVAPERFAAEGGEDYELLVALPPEVDDLEGDSWRARIGVPLTRIGVVREGWGVRFRLGGVDVALAGFQHFR